MMKRGMFSRVLLLLMVLLLLAPMGIAEETPIEPENAVALDSLNGKLLSALQNPSYDAAYAYLAEGNEIKSGTKGDPAKGLQQIIVDLGIDIKVDGNIGKKTMAALNEAIAGFTDSGSAALTAVTEADMQDILLALLVKKDEQAARELLSGAGELDVTGMINYYLAADQLRQGNGYTARDMYIALGDYKDSALRALNCGLKWPKNGQVYRNSDYKKKSCSLKIKANRDADTATYVKIYTPDDVLVCTAFIAGSGSATVSLPVGNYYINTGIGKDWFGQGEAFGEGSDAHYSRLIFDGSDDNTIALKSGYSYTLTLQIQDPKQEANVGSHYQDYSSF